MELDLIRIEEILRKQSNLEFSDPFELVNHLNVKRQNFTRLKLNYLEFRHETEYLKELIEFNFKLRDEQELSEKEAITAIKKSETRVMKEKINDFKLTINSIAKQSSLEYEEIIRLKDDCIDLIGRSRELDLELKEIKDLGLGLNENNLVLELEKSLKELKRNYLEIELELISANETYEKSFNRIEEIHEKLPKLERRRDEIIQQEIEAIRISNCKDFRVEELCKWFKESITLTHALLSIDSISFISQSLIEVKYYNDEFIVNYHLESNQNGCCRVEFIKGFVETKDIMESSQELPNLNLCLSYLVNQIYIRITFEMERRDEIEYLISKGASYEAGELLIQSEVSNRCFLFKLDPMYPLLGLESCKILMIEVLEEGESIQEWNEKMRDYQNLKQFLPLLV